MIKYVMLDIDDTLLDFNKSAVGAVKDMFEAEGYSYSDKVMEVYHKIGDPLWRAVERKELTGKELREKRWGLIFKELGLECDSLQMEDKYHSHLSNHWHVIDGADVLLKYLKSRNYTVCIASNSYYNQQTKRMKGAGLSEFIDHYFVSQQIGFEKPRIEFFDACFKALSNPPKQEIIMIGDSLDADVGGGINAGIKTCWFNRKGKTAKIKADYEVHSLLDIMKIL